MTDAAKPADPPPVAAASVAAAGAAAPPTGEPPADALPPIEPEPPPPRRKMTIDRAQLEPLARPLLWLAVLVAIGAAGAWVSALRASFPKPQPGLIVVTDRIFVAQAPADVRVLAVAAEERRRATFVGTVRLGDATGTVVDDIAHLTATPPRSYAKMWLEGTIDAVPVSLLINVQMVDGVQVPLRGVAGSRPWSEELLVVRDGDLASPPVYPVSGRASSRLPSTVVTIDNNAVVRLEIPGSADGVLLKDGRRLRVDRSGLRVLVPPRIYPGAWVDVDIESVDEGSATVDILVDGRVRALANANVQNGLARARFQAPFDAPEGGLVVVRTSLSPWPQTEGRFAVARIAAIGESRAQRVDAIARLLEGSGLKDDLLLTCVRAKTCTLDDALFDDFERALMQRLVPVRTGADVASPPLDEQVTIARAQAQEEVNSWRTPYRLGCVLVFVLLLAWVAISQGASGIGAGKTSALMAGLSIAAAALLAFGLDSVLDLVGRI